MPAPPISASKPKRSFCLQALFVVATVLLLSGCWSRSEQQTKVIWIGKCDWIDKLLPLLNNGWRIATTNTLPDAKDAGLYVMLHKP